MWTRLMKNKKRHATTVILKGIAISKQKRTNIQSYPGTPPASMWLASVTSCDHTSYCHFCRPMTPHSTFPECTPTRMLMSTKVASRTFLKNKHQTGSHIWEKWKKKRRFDLLTRKLKRTQNKCLCLWVCDWCCLREEFSYAGYSQIWQSILPMGKNTWADK